MKASVDKNLDVGFVFKRPVYGLEDMATIATGVGISGIKSNAFKIKTGFEVGVNLWLLKYKDHYF